MEPRRLLVRGKPGRKEKTSKEKEMPQNRNSLAN